MKIGTRVEVIGKFDTEGYISRVYGVVVGNHESGRMYQVAMEQDSAVKYIHAEYLRIP